MNILWLFDVCFLTSFEAVLRFSNACIECLWTTPCTPTVMLTSGLTLQFCGF